MMRKRKYASILPSQLKQHEAYVNDQIFVVAHH
jgi:hypothetical protein